MTATVGDLVRDAERKLLASTTPRLDSQLLVGHALGRDRAWVIAHPEVVLDGSQLERVVDLMDRRTIGTPVAYLRGQVEWFGLDLEVTPAVLVPRPDTEILVDTAGSAAGSAGARLIADVGTGSGAIAVALAKVLPQIDVIATDVSEAALDVAARNVARHGLTGRITLMRGDLLASVPDDVDLIVANLPYLSDARMATLSQDVRSEPALALAGGPDGLDLYRRLAAQMSERGRLVPMVFEIDPDQAVTAMQLFTPTHRRVRAVRDLAGRDRVIVATV